MNEQYHLQLSTSTGAKTTIADLPNVQLQYVYNIYLVFIEGCSFEGPLDGSLEPLENLMKGSLEPDRFPTQQKP